jgi:hypothetical protein
MLSVIASQPGELRDKPSQSPPWYLGAVLELDFWTVCGYNAVKTSPHDIAAFETTARPTWTV